MGSLGEPQGAGTSQQGGATTFDQRGFTAEADDGAWAWGLELQHEADIPVSTNDPEADKKVRTTLFIRRSVLAEIRLRVTD
ncbi:MAG: hypothetical protein JNM99_03320 [Verrucomicrobiaceae bacterium]|nr:hypothetical protein [Verrucomicrobiaceae bacterium]